MKLLRRKPIRVRLYNGFQWDQGTVDLKPGARVRVVFSMTQNVCDRGFPSEDGKHRLTQRVYEIPFCLEVE